MSAVEHMISFFFQAEDGIRDIGVTGVQTCALPILRGLKSRVKLRRASTASKSSSVDCDNRTANGSERVCAAQQSPHSVTHTRSLPFAVPFTRSRARARADVDCDAARDRAQAVRRRDEPRLLD